MGRRKGTPVSPEHRAKISAALKGRPKPPRSDAHRAALAEAGRGRPLPDATRRKISESMAGHLVLVPGRASPTWDDAPTSYNALHKWVGRHFTKAGRCEDCGRRGRTVWASPGHTYTRNRDDWRELCPRCHWHLDRRGGE